MFGTDKSLSNINSIETSTIQLDNVKETINADIELNLSSLPDDIKFSTNKVNVFAEVEKFTEKEILTSVEIINAPKKLNYNFFPKKIGVKVFIPLKEFSTLNTSDYKLICDFSQYKGGAQSTLFAELVNKPNYVKTSRIIDNKLEFIFRMKIIGITGGIGSGKSYVAELFHEGIPVYNSDLRAKEIMVSNIEVVSSIKKAFGI